MQAHVEQITGRLVTADQWPSRYRTIPEALAGGRAETGGLEVTAT